MCRPAAPPRPVERRAAFAASAVYPRDCDFVRASTEQARGLPLLRRGGSDFDWSWAVQSIGSSNHTPPSLCRFRTGQRKAAEPPVIRGYSKAAEGIPRGFNSIGCSLVRKVELKRHLHELLNFLAPDLRRRELHTGERILHGGGETRIARVKDVERARLVAASFVHDELDQHRSLHTCVLEPRRGFGSLAADLFDSLLHLGLRVHVVVYFLDATAPTHGGFLAGAPLLALPPGASGPLAA